MRGLVILWDWPMSKDDDRTMIQVSTNDRALYRMLSDESMEAVMKFVGKFSWPCFNNTYFMFHASDRPVQLMVDNQQKKKSQRKESKL